MITALNCIHLFLQWNHHNSCEIRWPYVLNIHFLASFHSAIFLLLDLFLFSVRYLGADMLFCFPLCSCSSTSFSLASSPSWLSLSMVFWQLFLSSIPQFLQHFSLLPLLNSPISPLLFPV